MDIAGSWRTTYSTSVGEEEGQLDLDLLAPGEGEDGPGQLVGHYASQVRDYPPQACDIEEAAISGAVLRWRCPAVVPAGMMVTFEVTIAGDAMTGRVNTGALGVRAFSGTRVTGA